MRCVELCVMDKRMKAESARARRGNGIETWVSYQPHECTIGALATLVQCHWFGPPFAALHMAKSRRCKQYLSLSIIQITFAFCRSPFHPFLERVPVSDSRSSLLKPYLGP
jgi:hypothetical protein